MILLLAKRGAWWLQFQEYQWLGKKKAKNKTKNPNLEIYK